MTSEHKVKPLKARIHTLHQLQRETLDLIRKVRFQLQHPAHGPGMNDVEFLDIVLSPLEEKIYADRAMAAMNRKNNRNDR